jgi:DNA-binding HxlR family transcriptional regulator
MWSGSVTDGTSVNDQDEMRDGGQRGRPPASAAANADACSMECLQVLGERWTLLVLREIFAGKHRFSDIRSSLGVAPNLLSARLSSLIEMKILRTRTYQEPGQRHRQSYHLTQAGRDLHIALAALQQWSNAHMPDPPYFINRSRDQDEELHVAFVAPDGREVPQEDVVFFKTAATGLPGEVPSESAPESRASRAAQ